MKRHAETLIVSIILFLSLASVIIAGLIDNGVFA